MQRVYFYIDDSGVFHRTHKYFVYAGYVFLDKDSKDAAKREYSKLSREIADSLGRTDELKSYGLETKHKRALYNVMRPYESFALSVNLRGIYDSILRDKKSIHRFKDYALKRAIKGKVQELIVSGAIDPKKRINFCIQIDEQTIATNGYYELAQSIKEEFQNGIHNFDYGTFHKPIFESEVTVDVSYCDSSSHHLIQASDIFANRIYCSYVLRNSSLRRRSNHYLLHLP